MCYLYGQVEFVRSVKMGTAASTQRKQDLALRRQVEEKILQLPLIDSPSLLNLEHGTIRYRRPTNETARTGARSGYFYHAKFDNFSPAGQLECQNSEQFRLKYVTKAPSNVNGKVFYVYANGVEDNGLRTHQRRPTGRGAEQFSILPPATYEMSYVSQDVTDADPKSGRFLVTSQDEIVDLKGKLISSLLPAMLSLDKLTIIAGGVDLGEREHVFDYVPVIDGPDPGQPFVVELSQRM